MNELNCLRTKGYPYFALTCRSDTDKDDIWNDTFGSRERYATVFVQTFLLVCVLNMLIIVLRRRHGL